MNYLETKIFEKCDFIITPTCGQTPNRINQNDESCESFNQFMNHSNHIYDSFSRGIQY